MSDPSWREPDGVYIFLLADLHPEQLERGTGAVCTSVSADYVSVPVCVASCVYIFVWVLYGHLHAQPSGIQAQPCYGLDLRAQSCISLLSYELLGLKSLTNDRELNLQSQNIHWKM